MGAKVVPQWKRWPLREKLRLCPRDPGTIENGVPPSHRLAFALIPQLATALMTHGLPDFLLEKVEGL